MSQLPRYFQSLQLTIENDPLQLGLRLMSLPDNPLSHVAEAEAEIGFRRQATSPYHLHHTKRFLSRYLNCPRAVVLSSHTMMLAPSFIPPSISRTSKLSTISPMHLFQEFKTARPPQSLLIHCNSSACHRIGWMEV